MKKLLLAIGFGLVTFVATAQNFNALQFLGVQSLNVTNTAGFTNNQPFFGWSALLSTNATGLQYTNNNGTYVIVAATNTTSGLVTVSNGVAFSTNDTTALAVDIPLHADRNGNICTNYLLSLAAQYNATSTGAVICVFVPMANDDSSAQGGVPLLDFANTATVAFPVLRGGATNTVVSVDFSKFAGYQKMRLFSCGLSNSLGQAWIYSLTANTYIP